MLQNTAGRSRWKGEQPKFLLLSASIDRQQDMSAIGSALHPRQIEAGH
jgi:hypothetical protein